MQSSATAVECLQFSNKALRQAKYRDKHPSIHLFNPLDKQERSILAPALSELNAIFTEAVEAEARRDAYLLWRFLFPHDSSVTYATFFTSDTRPFGLVRGHVGRRGRLRVDKKGTLYIVDSGASLHMIGEDRLSDKEDHTPHRV